MKILRIIARLNVGGPARHVVWLTEALQDEEFQTSLVAGSVPPGEDDMGYFAESHGVRPVYIPEMSREISFSDLSSFVKIYRLIKAEKPDIVHTHTAKAGSLGRSAGFVYRWLNLGSLIGRPRRVKFVHTFHGHVFHGYYGAWKTRVFIWIERLLARAATDRIIVLSRRQLEEINENFGVGRRSQFAIVPLGLDADEFQPSPAERKRVRAEIGAGDRDVVVGYAGRLTEIKDLDLLLWAAASAKEDERLKFVIAGDGHLRSELERKAAKLELGDRVVFMGNRDDVAALYSAFDIVVITSRNEGTPLSLIEGMAAGKPFVATSVGGVPDLAGELLETHDVFTVHERGVLVTSRDPSNFRRALDHLAQNESLALEMGRRGLEFIGAEYDKERLVRDIKKLYRELAKTSDA